MLDWTSALFLILGSVAVVLFGPAILAFTLTGITLILIVLLGTVIVVVEVAKNLFRR